MKKKILIVDDDPGLLTLLDRRLKANGYEVVSASDGKEAIEKTKQTQPDMIIMDVMMAPMNGYQACREIKNNPRFAKTPIMLLTARGTESDKFWGTESGADVYVTKPYEPKELLQIIDKMIKDQHG